MNTLNISNIYKKKLKNNVLCFINILNGIKKNEILFILNERQEIIVNEILYDTLFYNQYRSINKWPEGLITNYYQLCKSYKYKHSYEAFYYLDLKSLKYIYIEEIPAETSTMYKELMLLKRFLNIKFIACINMYNPQKNYTNLIDLPLFFDEKSNNSNFLSKQEIYYLLINLLMKK